MNVSLTPELEALVKAKVDSGMYGSASEVVREGLRLLRDQDLNKELKMARLKSELQKGIDDVEAGRVREFGRLEFDQLYQDVLEKYRKGQAE